MNRCNARGEHHSQFAARVGPARPCNAHDGNFGGRCFNCGFSPITPTPVTDEQRLEDARILKDAEYYYDS